MLEMLNRVYLRMAVSDQKGQGLIEYGLILILVSLVVVGVLSILGTKIPELFNAAANAL